MKNIFSEELSGFVTIFQFFATFPSTGNPLGNVLLKIYSLLNLFGIVCIFVSAFFINHVLEDNNSLSLLVGGLVFCGLLLCHGINVLQAYLSRNEQQMIYQKFDEIDYLLQNQLLVNIKYQDLRRKFYGKFLIVALILFTIHCASIVSVIMNKVLLRYYLHLIIPVTIIRIRCMQNMFYVDLINEKLMLMNQKLEDIVHKNRDKMSFILFADKLQNFDNKRDIKKQSLYDTILVLKQVYGKIWDISNCINDSFGWSLLAIVTQYFIEFTSNGYWLFLALENVLDDSIATQSLCSIFPIVIILTLLAFSCYRCSENAQRTGVLIHKIERDINNDLQNALIREMSLQIIHEPIVISANGFFNINFTLLGSMSAATVTYLVILIQFQLSEIKKTSNSTAT
ncbi:unnamed protein product [Diamesa hyperborea]